MDLIKIFNNIYDIEAHLIELSRNHFKNTDGSSLPVSTLKNGLFGWLIEAQGDAIHNSIQYKTLLSEERNLNTTLRPDVIYNKAMLYGLPLSTATPSSGDIVLLIKISDILNINNKTRGPFVLEKSTVYNINGKIFMQYCPINIYFDATTNTPFGEYDLSDTNFDEDELNITESALYTNYLSTEKAVLVRFKVFQFTTKKQTIEFSRGSINEINRYNISFDGQLFSFNVRLSDGTLLDKYLGESNPVGSATSNPYCTYELYSGRIQIIFNGKFGFYAPDNGEKLTVEVLTTTGTSGNFEYKGNITTAFSNPIYTTTRVVGKQLFPSTGGVNVLDIVAFRNKLINYIQSKGDIITDKNIESYVDMISSITNTDNKNIIKMQKIRDDFERRVFATYILFRDNNNVVIPTNTVDIDVSLSKLFGGVSFNVSDDGNTVVIPAGSYIVMKKIYDTLNDLGEEEALTSYTFTNYRLMGGVDENLFDETKPVIYSNKNWIDIYKLFPDTYYVYQTPFLLSVKQYPFNHISFFRTSFNNEKDLMLYRNQSIGDESFVISNLVFSKNDFINNTKYKLSFNITTNIGRTKIFDDKKLSAHVLLYSLDENGNREYYGVQYCTPDATVLDKINYNCEILSDNKFDNTSQLTLKLFPVNSNGDITSTTISDVSIGGDVYVSILLTYDNGIGGLFNFPETPSNIFKYDNTNLYLLSGFGTTYDIVNSYQVLEVSSRETLPFYIDLGNLVSSNITINDNQVFTLKDIPIIEYSFLSDVTTFEYIFGLIEFYEKIFNILLDKLVGLNNIAIRFYNSYGSSKNSSINETALSLKMKIYLKTNYNSTLDRNINNSIISYMNNLNNTGGKVSFSNLTTMLETKYSSDIDNIEFIDINGLNEYTVKTYINDSSITITPEFFNIPYNIKQKKFNINIIYEKV